MPRLRRPRALEPGGTIGIAAPAAAVDPARLEAGEARLLAAGFRVVRGGDPLARRGYLAGDDAARARALTDLVRDPQVGAIVCARGGYGSDRALPHLDPMLFREARKPVVGYSDITTLLLWLQRCAGLAGFHGPMLEREAGLDDREIEALAAALTGTEALPVVWTGRPGAGGEAVGRLVGGSLTLLAASLGTPWEVRTRGALLLLEEVGEAPYRVDRLLRQLRAAGKLDVVAGVGVGALTSCDAPSDASPAALEVIAECLGEVGVPWVSELPFGHARPNLPWPVGARARLDGARGSLHILDRGVARR